MIWLRLPSSFGMLPWNALFDKSMLLMALRLPTQGGTGPPRPSELRFSAMTRNGVCALHVTPCQLQKLRDMLLQETKAPLGSEIWDLKQRRACRSVLVSSLVANGMEHERMRKASSGMSSIWDAPKLIILQQVLGNAEAPLCLWKCIHILFLYTFSLTQWHGLISLV